MKTGHGRGLGLILCLMNGENNVTTYGDQVWCSDYLCISIFLSISSTSYLVCTHTLPVYFLSVKISLFFLAFH